MGIKFCPFCGGQLQMGYKFCPHCGKTIPALLGEEEQEKGQGPGGAAEE